MKAALPTILSLSLLLPSLAHAQEGRAKAESISKTCQAAHDADEFVRFQAKKIADEKIRAVVQDMLANPAPTFMSEWPDHEAARKALVDAGLLDAKIPIDEVFQPLPDPKKAPQPFTVAPGGTPEHHHGYPGGLAVHTAFNLQAALDLERNYQRRYGVTLNHDWVIAAPILHDTLKSWTFQWRRDGTITKQGTVADTGSHHVYITAEALHRGLPPALVIVIASAHDEPMGATAPRVVGYLRAAAILAKVDPVALEMLAKDGDTWTLASPPPIEASINHLSDHDFVMTDPAATLEAAALDRLAGAAAKADAANVDAARLTWMRHRIHAKVPGVTIYSWLAAGGDERVAEELKTRGIKLVEKSDLPPAL